MGILKSRRKKDSAEIADAVYKQFEGARQITIIGETVYIVSLDGQILAGRFKDGAIIRVKPVQVFCTL